MEVPDSRVTDEQANSTPSPIPFDCEHNCDEDDDEDDRDKDDDDDDDHYHWSSPYYHNWSSYNCKLTMSSSDKQANYFLVSG